MNKKLNCVLLIDDDEAVNFLHQAILKQAGIAESIVVKENGQEAIDFLKEKVEGQFVKPDLIFLDINMPIMDGWDFLEEYKELPEEAKAKIVLFMLTTSLNPQDRIRAEEEAHVNGFKTKPLDDNMIEEILNEYYSDHL